MDGPLEHSHQSMNDSVPLLFSVTGVVIYSFSFFSFFTIKRRRTVQPVGKWHLRSGVTMATRFKAEMLF